MFLQSTHLQSLQNTLAAKHSQYSLRHCEKYRGGRVGEGVVGVRRCVVI